MAWRRWLLPTAVILTLAGCAAGLVAWLGLPDFAFGRPWFLTLLVLIPAAVALGYRNLANLGPFRRWTALTLRCLVILLLVLALAELQAVHEDDVLTVLVLLDRSYSIPQERVVLSEGEGASAREVTRDRRLERLSQALAAATRGRQNRRDQIGVVVFGHRPRLEFPATSVPELNVRDLDTPDGNFTDIAAAIRLGLASFPEGTARRLLLISDGNENRGDAVREARTAKLNGVPIDVVPVNYSYQDEILVDRIDAPPETLENRNLPIRILVRNYCKHRVAGQLALWHTDGRKLAQQATTLDPGLNVILVRWPADAGRSGRSFSFRATFTPDNLPADRPDNNLAWSHVIVRGNSPRVLLVVQDRSSQDYQALLQALTSAAQGEAGRKKFEVDVWSAEQLPGEKDARIHELNNYDSVVLFNIPADQVNQEQQEALRKNIADQGVGLVMVGGQDAFGAGRWQGEPLEEALPVNTTIQALKVQSKGGLALIMHASEMAQGNYWQKEIAKLAVKKLSPVDEVGVLQYGMNGHHWHVPLQPAANRTEILKGIDRMTPGDMPDFDGPLKLAEKSLIEPQRGLSSKHIIIISDGDPVLADPRILRGLVANKITVTTVGVATHGPAQDMALQQISRPTGGRHYTVTDPKQLPSIYIKETKAISQNFLHEEPFKPEFIPGSDPLRDWNRQFPPLYGYVRTTPKDEKLVQIVMRSPVPGYDVNPLLAQWQYGLGRVVAFTSDAGATDKNWAREWARNNNELYTDFWARLVEWTLRNVEDTELAIQSRYENGKVRVSVVDNRSKEARAKNPLGELKLTVSATATRDSKEVRLEPTTAGVYEAAVDAEAAGSYLLTVRREQPAPGRVEGQPGKAAIVARAALTVPYSPEFAAVQSNPGLLEQVAQETGGRVIGEADLAQAALFRHDGAPVAHMQPVWYWLLLFAACGLFFDVAVRRIALEPADVAKKVKAGWDRLRGRVPVGEQTALYLERLKNRKALVGEELDRGRAARRFEGGPVPPPPPAPPPRPAPAPRPQPAASPAAPPDGGQGESFAERLRKAKERARQEIEKEQKETP